MNRSHWLLFQIYIFAMLGLVGLTSCVHTQKEVVLVQHDDALEISPPGAPSVSLHSRWTLGDPKFSLKTTVIMVPGSGSPSVASGVVWQEKLARAGYDVFAYEKRLKTSGPSALASDLDSACDAVRVHFGKERNTILWTSDQGTQVVLNARCLNKARALVVLSPIPDALERVWIAGLKESGFRDRAESLRSTFDSIRKGLFAPDAKVMGASLAFWKNWLELSQSTSKQLEALKIPVLFVVGEDDALLGRYGRSVVENLVKNRKNRQLIVVPKGDRNLFQKEALSQTTIETILGALGVLEKKNV